MNISRLLGTAVCLALTGCSMMNEGEDTTDCGLFVTFMYDYNLQRADMFHPHVGGLTLYVYDESGHFVRSYEQHDIAAMGRELDGGYVHALQILDLPDGRYRLVALALQKPYEATLATPGAKYRIAAPVKGDICDSLTVCLERSAGAVSDEAPLDTLWHAMTGSEPIAVERGDKQVARLSMTRDTKMLTIGLHNLDDDKRADISADEFDISITDRNGRLAYNNDLLPDEPLVYTPFHRWNTTATAPDGSTLDATAHACLTFNRLVWHPDADSNARLVIRNKATGLDVADINLTDALAQGRNAYDTYAYSRQEYLDRSYDYYMDFFIRNGVWQYAEVRLGVLSWAVRIDNIHLE